MRDARRFEMDDICRMTTPPVAAEAGRDLGLGSRSSGGGQPGSGSGPGDRKHCQPSVLLPTGGFLGTGETSLPIPPQALQWQPGDVQYRLDATASELEDLPRLTGNPLQVYVRRSDLEQLYGFFDIGPYRDR